MVCRSWGRIARLGKFEQQIGVLTENQERIFWLALKSGFFDYPRQIGMAELAAKLGISPATLSEIIRRGTRRLLEHYFKRELYLLGKIIVRLYKAAKR